MKCKDVKKNLSVYQDNRLSPNQKHQMKKHLAICRACRQEERTLSEMWNMLEAFEPIKPSPDFKARFWRRTREEEAVGENWWNSVVYSWRQFAAGVRPAFALTSVFVVSILGTLIALNIWPGTSVRQDKSPILQWTQGAPKGFMEGGF